MIEASFPTKKFKDVARVVTGKTPSKSNAAFFGGDIPFVTPAELDASDAIVTSKTTLTPKGAREVSILPQNSVLVSCIGTLGKVGFAGKALCTNQQINALVFDEAFVYPRYGYWYCKTLKPYLELIAPSTTLAIVNKTRFSDIEIPLPPLPEQRRIAAILDKADALRAKRRAAIAKLDQLLQSVFLDMFGDPVTNPKAWPTAQAGEVFSEFVGGKNVACPDESGSPFRILKVSAVTSKTYLPLESKPAPPDFSPTASTLVQAGDLLFSRANTSELVAATAYVWSTPKNMVLPDKVWKLVLGSNHDFDVMYIWELFKNESFRRKLAKTASGTSGSMKNISKSKLRQVTLLVPPFEMQAKFGKMCRTIHAQVKLLADAEAKAEKTFLSLQQCAFSGQLSPAA